MRICLDMMRSGSWGRLDWTLSPICILLKHVSPSKLFQTLSSTKMFPFILCICFFCCGCRGRRSGSGCCSCGRCWLLWWSFFLPCQITTFVVFRLWSHTGSKNKRLIRSIKQSGLDFIGYGNKHKVYWTCRKMRLKRWWRLSPQKKSAVIKNILLWFFRCFTHFTQLSLQTQIFSLSTWNTDNHIVLLEDFCAHKKYPQKLSFNNAIREQIMDFRFHQLARLLLLWASAPKMHWCRPQIQTFITELHPDNVISNIIMVKSLSFAFVT